MHEMGIMQGVFQQLQEVIKENQVTRRIEKVFFKVGRLNAVLPDSLQFYFSVFQKENDLLSSAILEIEIIDLQVRCKKCSAQYALSEPVFICSYCGGAVEVIAGDKMWLDSIEIE